MNSRLQILARCFLGLAIGLAGCGVGVIGTGTGDDPGPGAFGAAAASACSAPFASLVGCTAPSTGTPAPPPTASATFLDLATGKQVSAVFDKDVVSFEAICPGLQFRGGWGVDATGSGRYYGGLTRSTDPQVQLATLDIALAGNGNLLVTLRDKSGAIVFGPRELKPATTPTLDPSSCP